MDGLSVRHIGTHCPLVSAGRILPRPSAISRQVPKGASVIFDCECGLKLYYLRPSTRLAVA